METAKVRPGIDSVPELSKALFLGKKLGLVTNQTGLTSDLESSIAVLKRHASLSALFGPEHGIRGFLPGGTTISNYLDPQTQVPVYSLYGETKAPSKEMLYSLDTLVYDIQDVGSRFYTYISTMFECMKAAAANGKEMVVLDRPNPLGGEMVEGPVLDAKFASFIGLEGLPIRYGLTPGELAQFMNAEFKLHCKLTVVPLRGWKRNMLWDRTGLFWQAPSPNIPTWNSALVYAGTCLFEGTNVSEGRGTAKPFECVGAPWIDGEALAELLNKDKDLAAKRTRFLPTHFCPMGIVDKAKGKDAAHAPMAFNPHYPKFEGEDCHGVQICPLDTARFEAVSCAVKLLSAIRRIGGPNFSLQSLAGNYWINYLVGNDSLSRKEEIDVEGLIEGWQKDSGLFKERCKPYLLY